MTRIASIVLAVATLVNIATSTAGAMHINMSAPRISGGLAGGSQAFTPRPFNRMPDVSVPIGTPHVPPKHSQKAASKSFCEAIYLCCIRSGGKSVACCNAYNDDQFCPY
jgi:hypothetical protein